METLVHLDDPWMVEFLQKKSPIHVSALRSAGVLITTITAHIRGQEIYLEDVYLILYCGQLRLLVQAVTSLGHGYDLERHGLARVSINGFDDFREAAAAVRASVSNM